MESKIKIKFGQIEVEFEGSEKFLKEELHSVLEAIRKLHEVSNVAPVPVSSNSPGEKNEKSVDQTLTTSAAAKALSVKSGSELAVAVAAVMVLVQRKSTFTRPQLLTEMKTAIGYYEENYRKNLSNILTTLVKQDKFRLITTGNYTISSNVRADLEQKLGI